MPRRLPKRPTRPPPPSLSPTHRFLPIHRSHALIRRPNTSLESKFPKNLPPKIVALDSVPRIPLSPNLADHARRIAQIEQIKQLYSPREFKRLRDEQMKLVLPESPLKSTAGRIRLSILIWIYVSLGISCWQFSEFLYTKKEQEPVRWDFWKNWREWMPEGFLHEDQDDDVDPHAFAKDVMEEEDRERASRKGRAAN